MGSTSTATSGTDYAALGTLDSITITSGSTSGTATVDIDPTEDTIDEPDETIVINGSVTGFADTAATVTITDNDNRVADHPEHEPVEPGGVGGLDGGDGDRDASQRNNEKHRHRGDAELRPWEAPRPAAAPTTATAGCRRR